MKIFSPDMPVIEFAISCFVLIYGWAEVFCFKKQKPLEQPPTVKTSQQKFFGEPGENIFAYLDRVENPFWCEGVLDSERVNYCITGLGGRVFNWVVNYEFRGINISWRQFKHALIREFSEWESMGEISQKLFNLRYLPGKSFSRFIFNLGSQSLGGFNFCLHNGLFASIAKECSYEGGRLWVGTNDSLHLGARLLQGSGSRRQKRNLNFLGIFLRKILLIRR